MIDLSNKQLGQYQLIEVVRRGGMSTVYKAYQASLERYVAVKVLLHDRDPQFAARFKREARAIAQLQHHNILPVYDYGEQEGLLFLVLQYIENGETLGDMLGSPMEPAEALRLMSHVLRALDYAHNRGIVHRDIKPANVLMPSATWPMLADFGIAKLMNDNQQRLTVPGLIVGTAAYMAPEQATGQAIDARTDIYASGVMLYEMLTGRVPFDAESPMAVLTKHVYDTPAPLRSLNASVPALAEAATLRALSKDPAGRFQSAAEMAEELERIAARLDQDRARGRITGLYRAGVAAFEAGHWDEAVERFSQLNTLDPDYEDVPDLLEAARAAQERVRTEARQQLDMVRQRRSTMHQQMRPPTGSAPTATPNNPHSTSQLGLDAVRSSTTPARPEVASAAPPARSAGRYAIWGVVALVLLAAIGLGASRLLGGPAGGPSPTSGPVAAATAANPGATNGPAPTSAAAPTAGGQPAATVATQPDSGVPAPDPAGKLIYESDFRAAASNPLLELARSGLKDQKDDPAFQHGFHSPGVFHFLLPRPNETHDILIPRFTFGDFAYQSEVWDNSDSLSGAVVEGLIFRVRDNAHFYAVLLDPRKGQYAARKLDGQDTWTDLIPWKASPAIKRRKDHNVLRVDASGDTFKIYLNGSLLDQFTDKSYPSGLVGMLVSNADAPTPHIHFDKIKIWSSDPPPPAPGIAADRQDPNGDMVLIPGGEFILGGTESDDAQPQIYQLPNFYIDRTEVTNAAYARCVAAQKCTPLGSNSSESHPNYATDAQYADYPVLNVSWTQAQAFCGWAGKRLPTEAEWEKAASWDTAARSKTLWPFGNEFDQAKLNSDEAKNGDTTKAGQFPAELNGTVDMSGNASEWTSTLFQPYPYNESDGREDPKAPGDRVYRGGSWAQTQGKAQAVIRFSTDPAYFDREIGFRCAATP